MRHVLAAVLLQCIIWCAQVQALPGPVLSPETMEEAFRFLEHTHYQNQEEYVAVLSDLKDYVFTQAPQQSLRWQRLDCWSGEAHTEEEFKRTLERANRYLIIAREKADQEAITDLLICRGWIHAESGNTYAAAKDYDAAVATVQLVTNPQLVADALSSRGELRAYQGDLAMGIRDLIDAQRFYEKSGLDYWIRVNLASIANAYRRIGNYEQALHYYAQLEERALALEDEFEYRDVQSQIGLVYEDMGRFQEALALFQSALTFAQKNARDRDEAIARLNIAGVQTKLERYHEAMKNLDAVESFYRDSPDAGIIGLIHLFRGRAFNGQGLHKEALVELNKAKLHIQQVSNKRFLAWVLKENAIAHAALHEWEQAYLAMKAYTESQAQQDRFLQKQQTIDTQVEFDVTRKETENARLKAETALKQQQLDANRERRRLQTAVIVLGSILVILLIVLIGKQIRRNKHLHFLSITDELTGLPNRRRIFHLGEDLARQAQETHAPFSVLVFDVDYFKRINDTHGHSAGDAVLRALAPVSLEAIRDQDYVGRTGGEEFMALLPGTSIDQATAVAQRVRNHIAEHDFGDCAPELHVTVSVGVAQLKKTDGGLERLIHRADSALYQAKRDGRNCVVSDR